MNLVIYIINVILSIKIKMAIISVEVSDFVTKKYDPYTIVNWKNLYIQKELLRLDGEW